MVDTQVVNNIFAYETNGRLPSQNNSKLIVWAGFGGRYVMDDANVPVSCTFIALYMLQSRRVL